MVDMSTSDSVSTQSSPPTLSSEDRSARIAVTVFPLLILAAFAAAMITPAAFKPLAPGVHWALGVIMFGMGLTLTLLVDALSLVGLVQTLRGLQTPLPLIWRITKSFHPFT